MITSEYDYITELTYDTSSGLYDLFLTTFNGNINVTNLKVFFCEKRHECRLDLVSADIYNDTKWVGSICKINNILNEFSIRSGDVLFYLPSSDLDSLLKMPINLNQAIGSVKNDLIKALKKKKPDGLRGNYINNRGNDSLPPTILPDNAPQIVIKNNSIKIAPNLFQSPNTQQIAEPTTNGTGTTITTPLSSVLPTSTDNEITKVLIKRYVKLSNG